MIRIDEREAVVIVEGPDGTERYPFGSPEAFHIVSGAWLRVGWDTKYVYGFSWLGRPIIQLPEDMLRIQEVIYRVRPDVIIETGIAHGGSLVFYASLCHATGKGRVIGVDVEIRPHNRQAIEAHELSRYITLVEGNSIDSETVGKVARQLSAEDRGLVLLDANHSRDFVLGELRAYSEFVGPDSYIVACDGIMGSLVGAPRAQEDWGWNNPAEAAKAFLEETDRFVLEEPPFPFNEGLIHERVTYWPNAFLRRVK